MRRIGDLIGLIVIGAIVACCARLIPLGPDKTLWWIVYATLGLIGVWMWNSRGSPQRPKEWLQMLGIVILMDIGSFVIDILLGRIFHSDHSVLEAATLVGGPAGFGLTAILIPGVLVVVVGGSIRSVFLAWRRRNARWRGPSRVE